jgi:hypothetical protein
VLRKKSEALGLTVIEHVTKRREGAAIAAPIGGRNLNDGILLILSVEPVTTEVIAQVVACVTPTPKTVHNLNVAWLNETLRDASCASFAQHQIPPIAAEVPVVMTPAVLVRCKHGDVAVCHKVTKANKNHGRQFFSCRHRHARADLHRDAHTPRTSDYLVTPRLITPTL